MVCGRSPAGDGLHPARDCQPSTRPGKGSTILDAGAFSPSSGALADSRLGLRASGAAGSETKSRCLSSGRLSTADQESCCLSDAARSAATRSAAAAHAGEIVSHSMKLWTMPCSRRTVVRTPASRRRAA